MKCNMLILMFVLLISPYVISQGTTHVWSDTTSVIILNYSKTMSDSGLRTIGNYSLIDNNNVVYQIYRIGIVDVIGTTHYDDTSKVALITERLDYKKTYTVKVSNVKDKLGQHLVKDTATFVFSGKTPNISIPVPVWKTYLHNVKIDTAWASGQENTTYVPMKAIDGKSASDGDLNSRWTASPLPQWWACKIYNSIEIREIQICFNYFDAGRTYTYDIEYSDDGVNWIKLRVGMKSIPYQEFVSISDFIITAQYWRILFTGNDQSNWAGLWELKMFSKN